MGVLLKVLLILVGKCDSVGEMHVLSVSTLRAALLVVSLKILLNCVYASRWLDSSYAKIVGLFPARMELLPS